jgi:hypothetical protein
MRKVRCLAGAIDHDEAITLVHVHEVLTRHAARQRDERYFWRWYATGPTSGQRQFITVAYVCSDQELIVVAAYPALPAGVLAYHRLRKDGSLCIPAARTESN